MPDPKQMSGIPRPVTDLPDRAISVRLIRGDLSKNIPNFPVELHIGSSVQTVKTDEAGRAQFNDVPADATVKAVAVVDGERLESQEFPGPSRGGIRLLLVATDKEKAAGGGPSPTPAVSGQVAIAGRSRFVMEPGEEAVEIYYLLDIVNTGSAPVNPPAPFAFDVPADASSATILEGSSPQASVSGRRVTVKGPFAPGSTLVQVGYGLSSTTGSLALTQHFPASIEQLAIIVKKVGSTRVSSPQITRQMEMPADGETYISATGGAVAAGQPLAVALDGLPHHSLVPRWAALGLAILIIAIGVWGATRPEDRAGRAADRKRLVARREKLFGDLVRLVSDYRSGRLDETRYTTKREQLVTSLEHIYGELDTDDMSPEPASHAA